MKQSYVSPQTDEFKVMPMACLLQNTSRPEGDVPPADDGGDD